MWFLFFGSACLVLAGAQESVSKDDGDRDTRRGGYVRCQLRVDTRSAEVVSDRPSVAVERDPAPDAVRVPQLLGQQI